MYGMAADTPAGSGGTGKPISTLSAVRTNARLSRGGCVTPRFWYMLPDFAPRHLPAAFVPRINHGLPWVETNLDPPLLIDANFSTFWAPQGNWTSDALKALLNSIWCRAVMEALGTPLGGGALKLEATHLRHMPVPVISDSAKAALDSVGKQLAKDAPASQARADAIVLRSLCPGTAGPPTLSKLAATIESAPFVVCRAPEGRVMIADLAKAKETIRRCREYRESGKAEAVLRSEINSRLRLIFPSIDDESWINYYTAVTETHIKVGQAGSGPAGRFIDNLVEATTIEYSADLRIAAKRDEGFAQVRDHTAGLILAGVPVSQIRGILSDTVEWHAYDVTLAPGVDPGGCTADDVTLVSVEELKLSAADDLATGRLIGFLRKHLARQQSRLLTADFLTLDLGLDSVPYQRNAPLLLKLVNDGRTADPAIALATDLWSEFVDYLESDAGAFRAAAYADEVYLLILARLLSANVLDVKALLSADEELKAILDGEYFLAKFKLVNMVEFDYFGWLTSPQHFGKLVPIVREIQRDLYAYDFYKRPGENLFGRLMTQLARRSQRKLLGQEWTPAWLARLLAERCLDNLPAGEPPRIVDMCCGSGTILAEILKAARDRLGLANVDALHDVATGFDIDPLAVSLSKTTWVVTLAPEILVAGNPIVIPVYHADSLFAVTPVSAALPFLGEEETIDVTLDGVTVKLPRAFVQPVYRNLFICVVDWAYNEACKAQAKGSAPDLSKEDVSVFLDTDAAIATDAAVPADLREALVPAVQALVNRMAELAVAGRNGIWAFILRNTYRPGLLTGQFNGLVSNPPWLAMSRLADNPYRAMLTDRANLYGIKPVGQSFLHLELGTTHLLHAVDRYLKPGASVACLVPGTIFNGHHHEPLRQRRFLSSKRPIALEISEVWQVAPGTFKYPGAAIIGHKRGNVAGLNTEPAGALAQPEGLEEAEFSTRKIGTTRTAWVLEKEGEPFAAGGMKEPPQQGADLMPRTAVCVEILHVYGEEYRVDTPHSGFWAFTIKEAKELKNERFPGHVAPRFLHRIAQSKNLLPFHLGAHRAPVALPAKHNSDGIWQVYGDTEIQRMGFTQTARRFQAINAKLKKVGQGKSLQERIDEHGKLVKQVFGSEGHLIVAGAGGKHISAACIPVAEAQDLIIDQTLYWKVISVADEAWFCVAMLNSHAMTEAIIPFNPKGAFGGRHIHALPYRLMPACDPANEDHVRIAALALEVAAITQTAVANDEYLNDPNCALHMRRTRLRKTMFKTEQALELELLCAAALDTTAFGEDAE